MAAPAAPTCGGGGGGEDEADGRTPLRLPRGSRDAPPLEAAAAAPGGSVAVSTRISWRIFRELRRGAGRGRGVYGARIAGGSFKPRAGTKGRR